jgi:hypothetical protein
MPTVIHTKPSKASGAKKERTVGFLHDPVSGLSRPVNTEESWACYDFEMHARKCAYCFNPYEVHRSHQELCDQGHRLAQQVARYVYNTSSGETYSTTEEDHKLVRIELPTGYDQVRDLLKAIERSLRHRSRTPFVSMDRSYYVAARIPTRKASVKVEQTKTKRRPRTGEIVDWPAPAVSEPKKTAPIVTEVNSSIDRKRGSLYEQDLANQRRNAQRYKVEVREPSARDLREHRLSGYYR